MRLRIALGVSAAALVLPGLANAATLKGVVVAKQPARGVLVVASARGQVTTLRVSPKRLSSVRVGTRVAFAGAAQADGSLRTTRLTRLGRAKRTHLRVVVVKVAKSRLLVAGGGSAFSIDLKHGTRVLADAAPSLQPGDEVDAEVELGDSVVGSTVQQLGQAPLLEFTGTVSSVDAASLQITSNGIATTVQLPDGIVLPPIVVVGAHVEVVASISGSTLTLTMIKVEDAAEGAGQGGQGVQVGEDGEARVEGTVTAIAADSITIQPGDGAAPVTLAIPADLTIPAVTVGDTVEAKGESIDGVLTLSRLEVKGSDGSGDGGAQGGSGDGGSSGDSGNGGSGSGDGGGSGSSGGGDG